MEKIWKQVIGSCILVLIMGYPTGAAQKNVIDNLMAKVVDEWISSHPVRILPWNQFEATMAEVIVKVAGLIGDQKYRDYAMDYMNKWIDEEGVLLYRVDETDEVYPGVIALWAYEQTNEEKYLVAAEQCKDWLFEECPRLSNGAFPHLSKKWGAGILAVETATMVSYFLTYLGKVTGKPEYLDEATNQLIIMSDCLQDPGTGLLYQAWTQKEYPWADSKTHRSSEFWGRGMGWYMYGLVSTLNLLPLNHKDKDRLITILNNLVKGLAKYQDKATGLWYQVVDKGERDDNWVEQSCTGYFVYGIVKAVKNEYIDESYLDVARKAYLGLLTKIYVNDKGKPIILGTADATPPGDYLSYVSRPRKENYGHGLFAFLLATCVMKEYDLLF